MKYRWQFREIADSEAVSTLQRQLNDLPEALARSLVLRGIDSFEKAREFFRPAQDRLHDPFLMADMDIATDRIVKAKDNNETVLVYGDYDVDGTSSVALLSAFLTSIGVSNRFFIPHRINHGYGLCNAGIDEASSCGASLIIALDCGITAVDEAAYARSAGIDLIICDHHTPPVSLPVATAILNPKRNDCNYPFKELSACGVAFKFIQAIATRLEMDPEVPLQYLDLVALSIGADIVPIEDENRILMSLGIEQIRQNARVGIKQLAVVGGINSKTCSTGQIVFGFAPRINAAGRVDDASIAANLLLTDSLGEARTGANLLEELNDKRRSLDKTTVEQAIAAAERMFLSRERHGVVLFDDTWHPGVIGITASRIVERFYRPAILLTEVDGVAKGSARSISGVNIYDVLAACSDLLIQFGGHDYAAGMTLRVEDVDAFRDKFNEEVGKRINPEMMIPAINIDATVELSELTPRFWAVLKQFEPFGPANSRPVYCSRNLKVVGRPRVIGRDKSHLKFAVTDSEHPRKRFNVVGFDMGGQIDTVVSAAESGLDLLFSVEENTWNGRSSLELRARDVRASNGNADRDSVGVSYAAPLAAN